MRWLTGLVVLLLPRVALAEGPATLECSAWVGAGGGSRSSAGTPTVLAYGSVLRLFLTTRARMGTPSPWQSPWEITAGIELEPSFLAPPYSWQRLAGARY